METNIKDLMEPIKMEQYLDTEKNEENLGEEIQLNRIKLMGFAKNIKYWIIAESLCNIILCFIYNWWYIFFTFIPIVGFVGVKIYNYKWILSYCILEICMFIIKFIILFVSFFTKEGIGSIFMSISSIIFIPLSALYIRTVFRFYKSLIENKDDLEEIKNGWDPKMVYLVY